jgi:hypothetical protein
MTGIEFPSSATVSLVLPSGVQAFSADNCSSGSVITSSVSGSAVTSRQIYLKMLPTASEKTAISTSATGWKTMSRTIHKDADGGTAPMYLEIRGDTMMGFSSVGSTYNKPYTVTLLNKYHTPVPNNTGQPIKFHFATNDVFLACNDVPCAQSINSSTDAILPNGAFSKDVFLRMNTPFAGEFAAMLELEANTRTFLETNYSFGANSVYPLNIQLLGGVSQLNVAFSDASNGCVNVYVQAYGHINNVLQNISNATVTFTSSTMVSSNLPHRYFTGLGCAAGGPTTVLPNVTTSGPTSQASFSIQTYGSGLSYNVNVDVNLNATTPSYLYTDIQANPSSSHGTFNTNTSVSTPP